MPGKLIIFWDYDTQWGADRSISPGGPKDWGYLEFENTERLLELHSIYRIPACFAVVGAAALPGDRPYHDSQQIRRIHSHGHEIASHSMYHEWLPGIGYSKLLQTLRESKDALEQCIGFPVTTFVPPYNQPFDYLPKFAISLSERLNSGKDRIDLSSLCEALHRTGFLFSRISFMPLHERIFGKCFRNQSPRPSIPERIKNVLCLRLRIRAGFGKEAISLLENCVDQEQYAVVYGHPHSLFSGNPQDEKYLRRFLEKAKNLVLLNRLQVVLPREVSREY
jgi:hypothetical protein